MSAPPIFQKGNIMKKSTVKIVDIAAIEAAAKSKLNGDNKLKAALGAVASQHMTGDASPDLYAACKLAKSEGKRLNLDPIRELLPTLGRAQKDAVAALYLVLTTAPKTAAKAWDIKQAAAKRKTATTLFGVRDAINELNSDSSKLAEKSAKGADGKHDTESPFEKAVGMADTLAKFIAKHKFDENERKIIMDKLTK